MKNSSKGLSLDMFRSGLIVQRIARVVAMVAVLIGGVLLLIVPARAQAPSELTQTLPDAPLGVHSLASLGPLSITHSVSQTVQVNNSEVCRTSVGGYTHRNSLWRVFDLDGEFNIFTDYTVDSVIFGVDNTSGVFDVTVRAYRLTGPFAIKNLTLLSQADISLNNTYNGTLVTLDLPDAVISPQNDLVLEIDIPSGQSQTAVFFPASNNLGQTGPSYLSNTACGHFEPIDLADLGYPDMHLIMTVNGMVGSPTAVTLSDFGSTNTQLPLIAFTGTSLAFTAALVYVFRRRDRHL